MTIKQITNVFGDKITAIHWGSYDGEFCQWLVLANTKHHICLPWEHAQYGDFLLGDVLAYDASWDDEEHLEEIYVLGQGEVREEFKGLETAFDEKPSPMMELFLTDHFGKLLGIHK